MPPTTPPPSPTPFMPPPGTGNPDLNRRMLMLALVCGVGFIVVVVALALWLGHKPKTAGTTGGSPTPAASATPTPTPTPSNSALAPAAQPSFVGFDALTTAGFTANQLEDLEFALTNYAKTLGAPGATITLDTSSIKSAAPNPNDPNATIGLTYTFSLTYAGHGTYQTTATLTSTTAGTFKLANSAGTVVYNSGSIDLYNGVGD